MIDANLCKQYQRSGSQLCHVLFNSSVVIHDWKQWPKKIINSCKQCGAKLWHLTFGAQKQTQTFIIDAWRVTFKFQKPLHTNFGIALMHGLGLACSSTNWIFHLTFNKQWKGLDMEHSLFNNHLLKMLCQFNSI